MVERKTLNLVVVGSSPTEGAFCLPLDYHESEVAQRKRVGLITQRSVDRNHPSLLFLWFIHCSARSAIGLVVKYFVANEVPRVRFPDGAFCSTKVVDAAPKTNHARQMPIVLSLLPNVLTNITADEAKLG